MQTTRAQQIGWITQSSTISLTMRTLVTTVRIMANTRLAEGAVSGLPVRRLLPGQVLASLEWHSVELQGRVIVEDWRSCSFSERLLIGTHRNEWIYKLSAGGVPVQWEPDFVDASFGMPWSACGSMANMPSASQICGPYAPPLSKAMRPEPLERVLHTDPFGRWKAALRGGTWWEQRRTCSMLRGCWSVDFARQGDGGAGHSCTCEGGIVGGTCSSLRCSWSFQRIL